MANIVQIQFTGTILDFVKFQTKHSVPFALNDGEINLVAYVFIYGEKATTQFIADGHSRSAKSVENYFSTLRKKGLIVGKELNPSLYLTADPAGHIFTYNIVTQ